MRIAALLLPGLFLVTLWQPKYLPDGEALLVSDFEASAAGGGQAAEGGLFPWRVSGEGVLWEAGGGYRGSGGVKLTAGGPRPVLEWPLAGPRRFSFLELRGMMRVQDVEPGDMSWEAARLLLYFRDGDGKERWDHGHVAAKLTGSSDWRDFSQVFPVPDFAATAHVRIENGGRSGVLWCDDVSLGAMVVNPTFVRLRALLFGLMALLATVYGAASLAHRREGFFPALVAAAILLGVLISAQWLGDVASALGVSETVLKKWGHFLLFTGFSYALYRRQGRGTAESVDAAVSLRRTALFLLALLAFAAATELLQLITIDRSPTVTDWLIDAAGIFLGAALAVIQLRRQGQDADK